MKSNFITADPLGYQAHTSFVKQAISSWGLETKAIILSPSMKATLYGDDSVNVKALPAWLFDNQHRAWFFVCQISIMYYVLFRAIFGRHDTVVLLSYYLPVLTMFSWAFSLAGKRLIVVEHNTLVPTNKLKQFAFRLISSKVTHICFEDYIAEFVRLRYGRKAHVVRIPIAVPLSAIEPKDAVGNIERIVFMPSSTVEMSLLQQIESAFDGDNRYVLYCKGESSAEDKGVVRQKFFQDYSGLLSKAFCVLIPQPFDYRVSGVFYEALLSGSIVGVADTRFGRAMEKKYPSTVVIIKEWSEILSALDTVVNNSTLGITQEDWNNASGEEFLKQINL
jgi:hypothetical protein